MLITVHCSFSCRIKDSDMLSEGIKTGWKEREARKGTGRTCDCIWKLWAEARCNCKEAREPQGKNAAVEIAEVWGHRTKNELDSLSPASLSVHVSVATLKDLLEFRRRELQGLLSGGSSQQAAPNNIWFQYSARYKCSRRKKCILGSGNYHIDVCSTSKRNEHLTQHIYLDFMRVEQDIGFPARATHSRNRAHDN